MFESIAGRNDLYGDLFDIKAFGCPLHYKSAKKSSPLPVLKSRGKGDFFTMRILIKLFGYTLVGFFVLVCSLQFVSTNIRTQEVHKAATNAMTQTQTVMAEQIEDREYGTHAARLVWSSEDEYFNYFVDSFKIQLSTDNVCRIDMLDCDLNKGLLRVKISCFYNKLNGDVGEISLIKTGIVEKQSY